MTRTPLRFAVAFVASVSVAGAQNPTCTPEERREVLRALQRQILELAPRRIQSLEAATRPGGPLASWVYSHGHVIMAHTGAAPLTSRSAKEPMPQLLQYAPSPTTSPRDWLDFDGDDGPYRLIGWGYLAPFDPTGPPTRRCIDPSEWFVHDAGWHLMDGSMVATPDATAEPPRPKLAVPIHIWHPKQWDLHLWINEDGVPTVSFANPRAPGGGLRLADWVSYYLVNGRKELPPKPASR
jgi:hypothetical protein